MLNEMKSSSAGENNPVQNQTEQPTPVVPPSQPQATPNKRSIVNSKWLMLAFFAVILIIFVGGGAYLLSKNNSSPKTATITQNPTPTITPTATPTQGPVQITRLRPDKGPIGTLVSIEGIGFTDEFNLIQFGSDSSINPNGIPNNTMDSADLNKTNSGTMINKSGNLEFFIPDPSQPNFGPSTGSVCNRLNNCIPYVAKKILPGTYPVSVLNSQGQSHTLNFTVFELNNKQASKLIPGWKTYIDSTYGFSIDYPDLMNYHSNQPYTDDNGYSLTFTIANQQAGGFRGVGLGFELNPNKLSATDFVKQEAFKKDLPGWDNNKLPIVPSNLKDIDAVEVDDIVGGAGTTPARVFIADGATIIIVTGEKPVSGKESLLHQMLSTFKFTK